MMKHSKTLFLAAALLQAAGITAAAQTGVTQSGSTTKAVVQKETLLSATSSWDGTPYKPYPSGQPQLSVLKIIIPAHTQMQWHQHPAPNAAYVLSGNLTVEKQDGTKRLIKTGEVLAELQDTIHRGVAGDTDVVLIVFYAGAPGIPLSK